MNAQSLMVASTAIRQHDGLFSLNDLHRASGNQPEHRPGHFLRNEQTRALIDEISNAQICAFKVIRGARGGTYACRELVIAYAAWISAAFHLKVIRVFLDATAPAQPELPLAKAKPLGNGLKSAITAAVRDAIPTSMIQPPVWERPRSAIAPRDNNMNSPLGLPLTIVTAQKLIQCLMKWADEQLPRPVNREVWQCLKDLDNVLVTGWTEVDEALSAMSRATHYLHRWQGRNGRIGNIA